MKCLNADGLDTDLDPSVVELMNMKDGVAQAYMLGQLARSDDAERGSGRTMLDEALKRFSVGKEMFGCRMIRLDCKDELVDYYRSFKFHYIRKNEERNLNQMATFI